MNDGEFEEMVEKVAKLCSGLLSKQVHIAVYHRGN
jgi:hypothetical protein